MAWTGIECPFDPSFRWHLDTERSCLVLGDAATGKWTYEVDLDECGTSAAVLDWIVQVAGKIWATDEVVAGLVRKLDEVLDLQATLCSGGVEQGPIDAELTMRRVAGLNKAIEGWERGEK